MNQAAVTLNLIEHKEDPKNQVYRDDARNPVS